MDETGVLDETYERLHATGPEFEGWLSNHGPMAADAIMRLGHDEARVLAWLETYRKRLEPRPGERWRITESEWREYLGDPSRLGDWIAHFELAVREEPWRQLLVRWWPRLVPGAVASATHGMIRTGHVVRALREHVTPPRLRELAHALGYWAARWQAVPHQGPLTGSSGWGQALDALPRVDGSGGIRTRLSQLESVPSWPGAVAAAVAPGAADEVPDALRTLTDAAVVRYARWAPGNPIMLVHAATAPRAAALVLPELPTDHWQRTLAHAWAACAAISAAYRPPVEAMPAAEAAEGSGISRADLSEMAMGSGDEHVIKFVEVALESDARGVDGALASARRAVECIAPPA